MEYKKVILIICSHKSNEIEIRLVFDKNTILGDFDIGYNYCVEIIKNIEIILNNNNNSEFEWSGVRETFLTYFDKTIIIDNFNSKSQLDLKTTEVYDILFDLKNFMNLWSFEKLIDDVKFAFHHIKFNPEGYLTNSQFHQYSFNILETEYFFNFTNLDININENEFMEKIKINNVYFPFA